MPRGIGTAVVLAVVIILGVVFLKDIEKFILPHDTSIVVAPFEFAPGPDTLSIGPALSLLVTEDLARYKELSVVRAGVPQGRSPRPRELARSVGARYVLTGRVQTFNPGYTITLSLRMSDVDALVWEDRVQEGTFSLRTLKETVARRVLEALEIEQPMIPSSDVLQPPSASLAYLAGVGSLTSPRHEEAVQAAAWFRQALAIDNTMAEASIGLGRALLRRYKTEGERERAYLREAVDAALAARGIDQSLPGIYEVLGSAYRSAGRYDLADQNLRRALELQPANPAALRQLAMLSIVRGDYEGAMKRAEQAVGMDPRHPASHEVMGHVQYFRQQYNSAQTSYDQAITLGNNSFLVTTRYKIAVWGAGLSPEPVAEFCNRLLREDSTNYVVRYWIGRAYMLSGFWQQAKGHLESGSETLERILAQDPGDASARGFAALFAARLGESARGLEQADRMLELTGGSALAMYRKAQFYAIQTDKKAEALDWLQRAVRQEYILWEIMSPDFAFLAKDPEFRKAVSVSGSGN